MKWSLKPLIKGKKDGPGVGKSVVGGADSFRSSGAGVGGGGVGGNNGGGVRSLSQGDVDGEDGESRTPSITPPDASGGVAPDGEKEGAGDEGQQPSAETAGIASAPPFTVDATENGMGGVGEHGGRDGEYGEYGEGEKEGDGEWNGVTEGRSEAAADGSGDRQDNVFDDDSQEDADSLHASKTARIKSFADDPEGHGLGDMEGEWEGGTKDDLGGDGDERRGLNSPRASRGDDRSGTGGAGSHSYHSGGRSADAAGTEEFNSNASPDHPGGKANTYASFGGMSGGVSLSQSEPLDGEHSHRLDEEPEKEGAADDGHEEDGREAQRVGRQRLSAAGKAARAAAGGGGDERAEAEGDGDVRVDSRYVGGNNGEMGDHSYPKGGRIGGGVGVDPDGAGVAGAGNGLGGALYSNNNGEGDMRFRSRDAMDVDHRNSHSYGEGPDEVVREVPGYSDVMAAGPVYTGGGDRQHQQRQSNVVVLPPPKGSAGAVGGPNGLSAVDSRAAASLANRTRLAAGGNLPHGARPEHPPGPAAAAAAAALRRGPTPGSHSLPSMVLVPLEALKAQRRVPRSSDRRALVRYRDLPDRSRSFVVFVSHAWMRPHTTPSFAHPDTSSRGGEKYRLIAEAGDRIRAHLPPDVKVLLWIDYSCVDQDSTRRSKATMRGMREYMRRCDAILTVYPGEAADNGEEFLPNRFVKSCSWAGSYKSLAHYCTRGWCRLEMLLGQTEPLPQDGFMFNFLVPKKKKASGAKASVGDRPHFLYGAHQRPHAGRIDVVPRQSSRWFEEHHPEQGNFTHESDRDAIRAVLAKQTNTLAKRTAAISARYGTDPRRGGGNSGGTAPPSV